MKIKILLVLMTLASACHTKFVNAFSDRIYDCGPSVSETGQLIQLVGPSKQRLTKYSSIKANLLTQEGHSTALDVSEKACVSLPNSATDNDLLVVSQITEDKALVGHWYLSAIDKSVVLHKMESASLPFRCDLAFYGSQNFKLEFAKKEIAKRPYQVSYQIEKRREQFLLVSALEHEKLLDISELSAGEHSLSIELTDLYTKEATPLNCKLIVDRETPSLKINLPRDSYGANEKERIRLPLGYTLDFDIESVSPAQIFYCLRSNKEAATCEFRDGSYGIALPQAGEWDLVYYAVDAAGNKSPQATLEFIVWHHEEINRILTLVEASLNSPGIDGLRLALEAEKSRLALKTEAERLYLQKKVKLALLKSVNIQERWRWNYSYHDNSQIELASQAAYLWELSADAEIKRYQLENGQVETLNIDPTHTGLKSFLKVSSDGELAIYGNEKSLQLLSMKQKTVKAIQLPDNASVVGVSFLDNSRGFILALKNGKILSYETEAKFSPFQNAFENNKDIVDYFDLGEQIITYNEDGIITLWSVPLRKAVDHWEHGRSDGRFTFVLSPHKVTANHEAIVSGTIDANIKIWPLETDDESREAYANFDVAGTLRLLEFVTERYLLIATDEKLVIYDSMNLETFKEIPNNISFNDLQKIGNKALLFSENSIFELDINTWSLSSFANYPGRGILDHAANDNFAVVNGYSENTGDKRHLRVWQFNKNAFQRMAIKKSYLNSELKSILGCRGETLVSLQLSDWSEKIIGNLGCDETSDAFLFSRENIFVLMKDENNNDSYSPWDDFSWGAESLTLVNMDDGANKVHILGFDGAFQKELAAHDEYSHITDHLYIEKLNTYLTASNDESLSVYNLNSDETRRLEPDIGVIYSINHVDPWLLVQAELGVALYHLDGKWKHPQIFAKDHDIKDVFLNARRNELAVLTSSSLYTYNIAQAVNLEASTTIELDTREEYKSVYLNDQGELISGTDSGHVYWYLPQQKISRYGHHYAVDQLFDINSWLFSVDERGTVKIWDSENSVSFDIHKSPIKQVQEHEGKLISISSDEIVIWPFSNTMLFEYGCDWLKDPRICS